VPAAERVRERGPRGLGRRGAALELRLANERAEIARAHDLLDQYLEATDAVDADAASSIRLVVEELLANAISYAFPPGERHEIVITVSVEGDDAVVRICDDGRPFDPFERPPAAPARNLAEASIGGRGLLLVRAVTRSRSYRRAGDRNVVVVRIALGGR